MTDRQNYMYLAADNVPDYFVPERAHSLPLFCFATAEKKNINKLNYGDEFFPKAMLSWEVC